MEDTATWTQLMPRLNDNLFALPSTSPTPDPMSPTNERDFEHGNGLFSTEYRDELTLADALPAISNVNLPSIRVLRGRDNADLWLEDVQDVIYGLGLEPFMAGKVSEPAEGHRSQAKFRIAVGTMNVWLSKHMDDTSRRQLQLFPGYPLNKPWERVEAVRKLFLEIQNSEFISLSQELSTTDRNDFPSAKAFITGL